MLLAGSKLTKIVEDGILEGADKQNIEAASVDVRLGSTIIIPPKGRTIDLRGKIAKGAGERIEIDPVNGYVLKPNETILAHTMEKFNLPDNISCQFVMRSSMARCFLNHMLAGWADAGFHNSHLTLEFHNCSQNDLVIGAGMRIGQMVFFEHEPSGGNSYAVKGSYNNSDGVVESKGH